MYDPDSFLGGGLLTNIDEAHHMQKQGLEAGNFPVYAQLICFFRMDITLIFDLLINYQNLTIPALCLLVIPCPLLSPGGDLSSSQNVLLIFAHSLPVWITLAFVTWRLPQLFTKDKSVFSKLWHLIYDLFWALHLISPIAGACRLLFTCWLGNTHFM